MINLNARNFSQTKLAQGIDATTTTIVVEEALGVSPPFRVACENEIMEVTAVDGTTWTVTRGVENTTASAHNAGASVIVVFTAGMFEMIRDDINDVLPITVSVSYSDNRVSQITEQQGSITRQASFTYDSDGKVSSISQTVLGKNITYTLTYTNGRLTGVSKTVS